MWGPPTLVLLVGTGVYLTWLLRGLQLRILGHALYLALIVRREKDDQPGDISHFQALMTALAATVGTGNIAGVATAIAIGGPGALFWMWVTGLVGMATKYAEAVLAVRYRRLDANGQMCGGPMYYLERGPRPALARRAVRHLHRHRRLRHRQHGAVELGRRRGAGDLRRRAVGDRPDHGRRHRRRHPRRHQVDRPGRRACWCR